MNFYELWMIIAEYLNYRELLMNRKICLTNIT